MSMSLVPQGPLDTQVAVDGQRDEDDIALCEEVEPEDEDLSAEEKKFLEEFPKHKKKLERAIRKRRALADDIDRKHAKFTKASVVTNSVSVVSGAMSILGLALAPATAGGSLVLSAVGNGLGSVSGVASILTSIAEYFHNREAQALAGSQESTSDQTVLKTMKKSFDVLMNGKTLYDSGKTIKDIKKDISAFKIAGAQPKLATAAKNLLATGRISARKSKQVQKAFEGTTLMMNMSSRLLNAAMSGFSFGMDLNTLLKDWEKLKEGEKTECAEELRAQALELEKKLKELTQQYESLQQKLVNIGKKHKN